MNSLLIMRKCLFSLLVILDDGVDVPMVENDVKHNLIQIGIVFKRLTRMGLVVFDEGIVYL